MAACAVHLGTVPTPGFAISEVVAPVVEPGVDVAVRGAVDEVLAARSALGPEPLALRVERADWRPARRAGDVVVYDATLAVRFRATGRERLVTVSTSLSDPGSAGAADPVRAAAFAGLARRAAEEGVAWLVLGG